MPDLNIASLISRFLQPISPTAGGRHLWAIDKEGIRGSLLAVNELRRSEGGPAPAASRRGTSYGRGTYMTRVGSVAVVPVLGPLVARTSWSYWSYDEIIRDLRIAEEDDTIDAILLDVDSPGGMVANVEAAATEISRINAAKPVTAFIGGLGASAAYWLAASGGDVVAAPTSLVGSVGCLIRYMDIEGIFTKLGANIVEVLAAQSPNKRLDPASDEGQAELQAIVDNGAELFLEGLAEARGVDRDTLLANYGQGLVFTAQDALERGLIDRISSFEETLAGLADRALSHTGAASATARFGQETNMDPKDKEQGKTSANKPVTVESLRAEHGGLIAGIENAAATAAVSEERARVAAIQKHAKAGRETLIATMIADGTPAADAANKILAAIDAGEISDLAATASSLTAQQVLQNMDKAAEGVVSSPSSGEYAKADTPDGWKAEWDGSKELQGIYPTRESYVATKKREAARAA